MCLSSVLQIILWNGFVGIVARWLIWLVGEEMKIGMEFYMQYNHILNFKFK